MAVREEVGSTRGQWGPALPVFPEPSDPNCHSHHRHPKEPRGPGSPPQSTQSTHIHRPRGVRGLPQGGLCQVHAAQPQPWAPTCVHKCPCMYPVCRGTRWCLCSTHTRPLGPAVLTFLLCVREPEHRHGVALVAGGVCSITREGSWSKEQEHRALGSPWQPPQPSP